MISHFALAERITTTDSPRTKTKTSHPFHRIPSSRKLRRFSARNLVVRDVTARLTHANGAPVVLWRRCLPQTAAVTWCAPRRARPSSKWVQGVHLRSAAVAWNIGTPKCSRTKAEHCRLHRLHDTLQQVG